MVDLSGRTQTFHGQQQIDIFNAKKVEGKDADPSQFTPATFLPVEELETMLDQQLDEVQDSGYRRLLEAVFQDPETGQAFREGPASLHGHHNYRHGLLEHTVAVTWMASETAQIQVRLDRDLLICGALLHDIGRTVELKLTDVQIETTLVGSLIDHETLGTMLTARIADKIGLRSPAREGLLHLISTHHKALTPAPGRFYLPEAHVLAHLNETDGRGSVAKSQPPPQARMHSWKN